MPNDRRPIRIVTDSSADLTPEDVRRLNITVVPLNLTFGDETFADGSLTQDEFWRRVDEGVIPRTSQPSPGSLLRAFESLVSQGYDVICITITSGHSGTFGTATRLAAEFDDHVVVVDSRFFSIAMGWQAIKAAEMAQQGATRDEILGEIDNLRERTRVLILLESIEFLRSGGRAAALMPTVDRIARALSIHPILNITQGHMRLLGVARSTSKGISRMAAELASLGAVERVQIMHIQAPAQARRLVDAVANTTKLALQSIRLGSVGSVLACHGGRGVLGVVGLLAG